ncbi:MAG: glycosyltransferase [Desulfovibrionaceae bacterium]
MTSPSLVSMIVPTYNQARYLGACLDSIWFQDHPNLEIIVVNDCSTDDTRQVLEDFARQVEEGSEVSYASYYNEAEDVIERVHHPRYPRAGRSLKILHNEKNIGSTPTYNRGFQAATGDYCTYIASDDICHPQMVSTLAAPLDRDEADFVYSDVFVFDDNGRILREFKLPDYDFKASFADWYLCSVSKLYRRSLHETFGWYNNDFLANDHEFYLRLAMGGARFKHIAKTLYSIRTHDNREVNVHSSSNWGKLLNESKGLALKARAFLEGK